MYLDICIQQKNKETNMFAVFNDCSYFSLANLLRFKNSSPYRNLFSLLILEWFEQKKREMRKEKGKVSNNEFVDVDKYGTVVYNHLI